MAAAIFSKPWNWMDIVDGYVIGTNLAILNVKSDNINLSEDSLQSILPLLPHMIVTGFEGRRIYEISKEALFCSYRKELFLGIAAIIAATTLVKLYQEGESKTDLSERVFRHMINIVPKVLAISSLALVMLNGKNHPHRAVTAAVSTVMTLLKTYKKLPEPISKVWDMTPIISNGITFWSSNELLERIYAACALSVYAHLNFNMGSNQ